jgi:hypothetical protein
MGPAGPPPAPGGARGPLIQVATRCETLDELVAKFAGLASEGALVLPASGELPIGTEARFAIRLKDQTVVMRGRCRVTDARPAPGPAAAGTRPMLLRVALLDMEESSVTLHRRLLARRRATAVPTAIVPEPSDPTEVSPPRAEPRAPAKPVPPPPVSGFAATMIGVAPPRARVGTSPLGVARPPALAEPRPPGTPFTLPPNPLSTRPAETRAPGASFTLPANPLSEMNAKELSSFIDSTLFESDDEDATAERPSRPATDLEQTVQQAPPERAADLERTVQSAPDAPVGEVGSQRVEPTEKTAHAPPSVLAPAAGARDWRQMAMRARPHARRALPYVLCAVAGILIGSVLLRSPAPVVAPPTVAPAPAKSRPLAAAPVAKPAPPPAPVADKRAPAEAPAPPVAEHRAPAAQAARAADPAVGCQANVVTEPSEAKIAWRGKSLGTSPLADANIPCGDGTLTITHERYETVSKTLTAEAGVPVAVDERLHRPPATLVVNSLPQGAAISINGHGVGTTPRRVPTMRYEHLTIKATFSGYAPWTKKVYLKGDSMQVTAVLSGGGRRR